MARAPRGKPGRDPARRRACAFLTTPGLEDLVTDHGLSAAEMRALGWDVRVIDWRDGAVDWDKVDAVYIGTPWDYPEDPARFLRVLERIDGSGAVLVNDVELVRWTLQKTYLRDLQSRGVDIVPSAWYRRVDGADVPGFFSAHGTGTVVIKPQLGANAVDTHVLDAPVGESQCRELAATFRDRPFLVQPFIASIRTEGEYSLIFLGGEFSHAVCKQPRPGDFRVQEEHGAAVRPLAPPDGLVGTAQRIMELVSPVPAYARVDLVRDTNRYLLMELELIEPSLYLGSAPGAAGRFARALDAYVARRRVRPRAS